MNVHNTNIISTYSYIHTNRHLLLPMHLLDPEEWVTQRGDLVVDTPVDAKQTRADNIQVVETTNV